MLRGAFQSAFQSVGDHSDKLKLVVGPSFAWNPAYLASSSCGSIHSLQASAQQQVARHRVQAAKEQDEPAHACSSAPAAEQRC